jgi:hypothetical protein
VTGRRPRLGAWLKDWWVADARLRRLLTERDLGDFVTCVAVRA